MAEIDTALLRELLAYDPGTGALTWLARPRSMFTSEGAWRSWNSRCAGRPAFTSLTPEGYRHGTIFGVHHLAHRVAWAISHGAWPAEDTDHINGVRDDNRLQNLRAVPRQENCRNSAVRRDNSSGVLGVSWSTRDKKWRAQIRVGGRQLCLGYFSTLDAAAESRAAASARYGFHANHGRTA